MEADASGRDLFGRLTSIMETTDPILLMGAIALIVTLIVLGFMRQYRLLIIVVMTAAVLSGARNASVDSFLSVLRWIIIVIMAFGVVTVRQHPGRPILMFLALVVLGLCFSVTSLSVSWAIQTGMLFLGTTLMGITAATVMTDRAELRKFFSLFVIPAAAWVSCSVIYLPDFLAGKIDYGFGRFSGFSESSGMFSIGGAVLLPCLLWHVLQPGRSLMRFVSGTLFSLVLLLLLLGTQRTALYSGVIACVPLILRTNIRDVALIGTVALVGFLMFNQVWGSMSDRQSQYIVERVTDSSTSGRYELWLSALDTLLDDPIRGHGFGSDRGLSQGGHLTHKQRPHNWYIVIWHNTGVFGLLLLLATMALAILGPLRVMLARGDCELQDMARLVVGQLLGVAATGVVSSMGSPSNTNTLILILFLVASGRIVILARQERESQAELESQELEGHVELFDYANHSYG